MPTSDEDLQKMKDDTQALRDSVRDAELDLLSKQSDLANDTTAAQLKAEQDTLQARLAELKALNTKKAVSDGAAIAIDPEGTAAKQAAAADRAAAADSDTKSKSGGNA